MKKYIIVGIAWVLLSSCGKQSGPRAAARQKPASDIKMSMLTKGPQDSPFPEIGSTVLVHYTGWIAQSDDTPGRQIDSSIERKKPLQFTIGLGQVIKGFEEAVKRMQVGQKCRVILPSELAYGEHGVGLFIPPNSRLIFDIEFVAMK